MQMIYLSNERFPNRDAVTIQQMQMVEAFANAGLEVTFLRPYYFEQAKYSDEQICDFYGVTKNFDMVILPTLLSFSKPRYGVDMGYGVDGKQRRKIPFIGGGSMLLSTAFYIMKKWLAGYFDRPTIVYSRNLNAAVVFLHFRRLWLAKKPVKVFMEAHALVQHPRPFFDYLISRCDGIVSITHSLKSDIIKKYGRRDEDIFVAPDGVRARWLKNRKKDRVELRRQLGIPEEFEKVVVYSGGFAPGKGVEVFVRAAAEFGEDEKVLFYLVGGAPKTIREVQQMTDAHRLKHVHFAGFVPPRDIGLYQAAADVLVLPNTADYSLKDYTSPLKLFEYMAAERPIVASDLAVFREVLRQEENAVLVPQGDAKALARSIRRLLTDEALAQRLSRQARSEVEQYSWDARAARIIDFINSTTGWGI